MRRALPVLTNITLIGSQTLYASSPKTDIKIPQPTEQTPDQEQK